MKFPNLKQEQTYNPFIQYKKHTKAQSLASLTWKDANPTIGPKRKALQHDYNLRS